MTDNKRDEEIAGRLAVRSMVESLTCTDYAREIKQALAKARLEAVMADEVKNMRELILEISWLSKNKEKKVIRDFGNYLKRLVEEAGGMKEEKLRKIIREELARRDYERTPRWLREAVEHQSSPCLRDGLKPGDVNMISCPCPKCSASC